MKRGITIKEYAEKAGVSVQCIYSKIKRNIDLEAVVAINRYAGFTLLVVNDQQFSKIKKRKKIA